MGSRPTLADLARRAPADKRVAIVTAFQRARRCAEVLATDPTSQAASDALTAASEDMGRVLGAAGLHTFAADADDRLLDPHEVRGMAVLAEVQALDDERRSLLDELGTARAAFDAAPTKANGERLEAVLSKLEETTKRLEEDTRQTAARIAAMSPAPGNRASRRAARKGGRRG